MGNFWYGASQPSFAIGDRTLLHLQIVMVAKLRRGERFLFRCDTDEYIRTADSFWMSPDIPLRFAFTHPTSPAVNSAWLNLLAQAANTAAGLWIVPEPSPAPVHADVALERITAPLLPTFIRLEPSALVGTGVHAHAANR